MKTLHSPAPWLFPTDDDGAPEIGFTGSYHYIPVFAPGLYGSIAHVVVKRQEESPKREIGLAGLANLNLMTVAPRLLANIIAQHQHEQTTDEPSLDLKEEREALIEEMLISSVIEPAPPSMPKKIRLTTDQYEEVHGMAKGSSYDVHPQCLEEEWILTGCVKVVSAGRGTIISINRGEFESAD
jgi:hypothetical protein